MDRIDQSLDDIIKAQKGTNKAKAKTNLGSKKGPAVRTKTIQKNNRTRVAVAALPNLQYAKQVRKEDALFTETFRTMTAPIKEIFTSRYIPNVGPIKLVAINQNPVKRDPAVKIEREKTPSLNMSMDVDVPRILPGLSAIEPPKLEIEPATIEIENLDPGTTAEDVKVVCSRFGEIKSCMCTNGFSQVTYARKAAAIAAMQNLNGKTADNAVAPVHVPSAIAEPLKMVGKTVQGSILALQALKTLGRATEGCDSIFTEEGIRTLMYHSGLNKATEAGIDKAGSKEALKCLANALLLKPTTRPYFEKLEGHGQCSVLLKVLKTQLARSPDGTMFTQSMVLSEALKYLFNLMIVDPKCVRSSDAGLTEAEKTEATGKRFQSLLPTIVSILTTIPPSTPNPLEPPHSHAIHVLLNFPISTSALLVTRSQQASLLTVLMQILDDTLRYSLNTDEEASTDGMSNGTELDEIVPPLVIVLTNIASAGGEAKAALKARLLPDDVDRSQPLEKGNTFSARLIRRMTSIRFPQIRETVCNLLYVVCDEDAALLTRHVGYGNAAGFLMNRNLGMPASMQGGGENGNENEDGEEEVEELHSPTSATGPSSTSARQTNRRFSSASAVNPITGAYYPDPSAIRTAMADMTEEEKEEEAGKLLDMFDKLRRTGVMEVRNPALEAGLRQRERDRYYEEQERREREDEDDGDD
ncbi:hypothetical protein BGZ82_010799 [Podila clonocystis]|nr:hypothetical protein BGZ82_010799 [Podila clonocystis]